ncbi:heterokaryon incompatibility protein-domain-containing protein [Podospora didyma]|uniref:Heterokaryon incompatibility protein-domain-containing protein n=1 Tax=Podospora didyma TaxID=330526 RepID=A0AAE0P440_9PEZI|nr:heterokaryon incompatibility protein-domain-containing protein [Podospora didyma]
MACVLSADFWHILLTLAIASARSRDIVVRLLVGPPQSLTLSIHCQKPAEKAPPVVHKFRDDEAHCQLFEHALQKAGHRPHQYEALSYVWGSEKDPRPLYISSQPDHHHSLSSDQNGLRSLFVTQNLHTALLYLRDRYLERIIWIDAVCINQQDNIEKRRQVQFMAKIFAYANRVTVWLGKGDDYHRGDQILEAIRRAASASEKPQREAPDRTHQDAVIALLKRPWSSRKSQRLGRFYSNAAEMDGYAFCMGLKALKLSSERHPGLRIRIQSMTYLIQNIFRPQYDDDNEHSIQGSVAAATHSPHASIQERFSLNIRPLGELINMNHTHMATQRLDMVYALLGMSSDDPGASGLLVDYDAPWELVLRRLCHFCLGSTQISIDAWQGTRIGAVIKGKGCILGYVSWVGEDVNDPETGPGAFAVELSGKVVQENQELRGYYEVNEPQPQPKPQAATQYYRRQAEGHDDSKRVRLHYRETEAGGVSPSQEPATFDTILKSMTAARENLAKAGRVWNIGLLLIVHLWWNSYPMEYI